jgi:hypothetical protein
MTHAQYDRSLAAQLQSRAGDQWGYFQAKKLRGSLQQNTLELLEASLAVPPLDGRAFGVALAKLQAPALDATLNALVKGELPALTPGPGIAPNVQAALDAVAAAKPEADVEALLHSVTDADLEAAMSEAEAQAMAFDAAVKPVSANLDHLAKLLDQPGTDRGMVQSFTAAHLRFGAAMYDNQARLNQVAGYIFELQVRKSNSSAERHHQRSGRFFYGMLAAQMGVVISTLAIAARQKNLLWSLAAAAGLVAVSFSAWVFLRM